MPIQVTCPACRGPLSAPDHLAGSVVQCPRCQCQMVLPAGPSSAPPPPPSTTSTSTTVRPAASPGTAQLRPAFRGETPATAPAAESSKNSSEQTARFAPRSSAAPSAMTSDSLPALHLAQAQAKKAKIKTSLQRGPVLAALLAVSMAASLAMLFWEPGASKTLTSEQREAWQKLEVQYFGDGTALKPYQQLLREAQQAYHQGDRQREAALLRRVLDLLHAEASHPEFGVTGYQTPEPPNDEDLEQQIMILLRQT